MFSFSSKENNKISLFNKKRNNNIFSFNNKLNSQNMMKHYLKMIYKKLNNKKLLIKKKAW